MSLLALCLLALNLVGLLAQSGTYDPSIEGKLWKELLPWGLNTGPNDEIVWADRKDLNNIPSSSFLPPPDGEELDVDEFGDPIYRSVTPYGWDGPSALAAAEAEFLLLGAQGECTYSHLGDYDLDDSIYFPQVRLCKGPIVVPAIPNVSPAIYAKLPPAPGRLLNPVGIAVSGTKVYVGDSFNHRVQAFDFFGNNIPMKYPIGNGVPGTGFYNYDVTYPGLNYRPYPGLSNGGFSGHQLNAPQGIAVDERKVSGVLSPRLLVADTNNNRIALFNDDGSAAFGTQAAPIHYYPPIPLNNGGAAQGVEPFRPNQLAISPGAVIRQPGTVIGSTDPDFGKRIAMIDWYKCYVAITDVGFNLVKTLPAEVPAQVQHDSCHLPESGPSQPGQFSTVTGVEIDGAGNIYISDHAQNQIQVFNRDGVYLTSIGTPGGANPGGAGELAGPVGLFIDDKFGRLGVIDSLNARAVFYDLSHGPAAVTFEFQIDTTVAVEDFPMGVSMQFGEKADGLDPKGRIMVTDPIRRRMLRWELPELVIANSLATITNSDANPKIGVGQFDVVVPYQKLSPVNDVIVTVEPQEPGSVTVVPGSVVPSLSSRPDIGHGQLLHYTFQFTSTIAEAKFDITAKGDCDANGLNCLAKAPDAAAVARALCDACSATHEVYYDQQDPENLVLAQLVDTPDQVRAGRPISGWYDRPVFVRIHPVVPPGTAEDDPNRVTQIAWSYGGAGGQVYGTFVTETSTPGEDDAVKAIVRINGVTWVTYQAITAQGSASAPVEVVLPVDIQSPSMEFTSWTPAPTGTDGAMSWYNVPVTGVYRGLDQDSGPQPAPNGGVVQFTTEGRDVFTAFPIVDFVGNTDAGTSNDTGRGGRVINIDMTAPNFVNGLGQIINNSNDGMEFILPFTGIDANGLYLNLAAGALSISASDPNLTNGQPGSRPSAFIVGNLATTGLRNGGLITFRATDYAGNSRERTAILRLSKAVPVASVTGGVFTYNGLAQGATACTVRGLNNQVLPGTLTYAPGPNAPINVGSVIATCAFAGDSSYEPVSATATVTINKATPVVTIGGGPFTYDGTLHPATCSVAGVAGQTLTGALTYAAGSAPINATTGAAATCSFAGDANYNAASANRSLVVNPRPITITAQAKTKLIGALDPALSYSITAGSLVAGDSLSGSLVRVAGEALGAYAITQGTLSAGPNYLVTYIPANLSILPINVPPVAVDDAASTTGAAPVTIAVLGNDSDLDGGTLSVTGATQPTGGATVGTVTTSGNQVVFTPAVGFVGTAVFTYTISDGQGGTATATVRVTVAEAVCVSSTAALVRGAVMINSGSRTEGTIQVMTAADVTFNGGTLVGDLKMLGMPTITVNGTPTYGSTLGTGATTPTSHRVTINSGTTMGNVVRRTDAVALPTVNVPPTPTGTRSVNINLPSDSPGAYSTLRDLTLNANAGSFAVPAGTYGNFIANSGTAFVIGVAGATTPSVYNFETLTLNSGSTLQVVGPVLVTLKNQAAFNGNAGSSAHRDWLTLRISTGGLTLDSAVSFYGYAQVPNGAVIINSGTQLVGALAANTLTLNGTGKLLLAGTCNRPPTVTAPNRTNNEGDTVSVQITGTDPDGDALTYSATGLPPGLSMNASGLITGTLSYASAGTYNVTVTVTDPSGLTGTATFVWTVLNVNRPPTVSAPNRTDMRGTTATGLITGSDPDGDALTYSATGLPPGATFSSTGVIGGVLTTSGVYTVTVTVKDPSNATGTGTFTWTVLTPNVPPVATNDAASSVGAAPVTLTVLGNDSDADGGTLSVTAITQPTGGATVGVVTTSGNQIVFTPAANFVGTATFTYTISDGQGGTATATVTVTITAPAACTSTGYLTYSQGGWGNGGAPGQFLAAKFAQVYPAGYVTIGVNNTLKFTSASAIDAFLPAGGSPSVLTSSAVNPTSSAAGNFAAQLLALRLAVDFSAAGATKTGMGNLVMVSGPFAGSTVDQILAQANAVIGGQTSALPSGMSVSTLSGILESLNMNFHEGTVNNGLLGCPGTCIAGTIALSADSFATSGTAGNIRTFTGAGVSVKASAFSRAKSNGAWSAAFLGAFGNAGLGVTDGSEGSGADDSHKTDNIGDRLNYLVFEFSKPVIVTRAFLDYIGADGDATIWLGTKTDPFNNHITLSDAMLTSLGTAQSSTSSSTADRWAVFNGSKTAVNVLVIAADVTDTTPEDEFKVSKLDLVCATQPAVPPTVTASNKSNEEGAAVSVQIAATDPDAQALTYSAAGLPPGLSINATTGLITGTLGYTSAGTYNVTISVTDEDDQTSTATFVWTVTNLNRPPTVTTASRSNTKGATVSFPLTGTDPDGDAITYSATGLPPGASISAAGVISGTLTTTGTYTVTVTVKDPSNATGTSTFTWTVIANRAPTVTAASRTDNKGATIALQLAGSDLDGDTLTYSATGLPPGLTISSTGKITGTLTTTGTYTVTVTVKDPSNATGTATFTWTVKTVNQAPDAKNDSLSTSKNTSKTITVLGNDTDPNGDSLTLTGVTSPSKGTVVKNSNGTIKYTPPSNWIGTTSFTYTISDGKGGSDTATVTVTVASHTDNDDCDRDHDHNGTRNDDNDRRERDCDRNHQHTRDCERRY